MLPEEAETEESQKWLLVYRRERARIEKIKRKKLEGSLILRSRAGELIFRASRICRDTVLNVGPRIASTLTIVKSEKEIIRILQEEHNRAFDEMVETLKEL